MLNNMPTGIMTAPTQTKKVSNTPSPRNTSFPKIVGLFLPFVSLWNYLAHKKLTPLATAPLSPMEMDCILPMECLSLSINLPLNKPAFTFPPWLLKSFLHEAKDAYLEAPPGTSWRPELWPSFHFPAIQSVMWPWGWTTFCTQTAVVFFTFSVVFNKLQVMFNTLL